MPKIIPLTQNKIAIVDAPDFEWLNQWKWHTIKARRTCYAARADYSHRPRRYLYMHQVIMTPPSGMEVDHINGNGLDNRRINLRLCTHHQNCMNNRKERGRSRRYPSKFKGVSWHTQSGKWRARIQGEHLGCFNYEIEAALAYNEAARRRFGEFANLNETS